MFVILPIKRIHHYVPQCPRCKSYHTGRYVFVMKDNFDTNKIIYKALKHGELIRIVGGFRDLDSNNAYCEECGAEWYQNIQTMFLSDEQIQNQIKLRGITKEQIYNMKNHKAIYKKQKKQEKKEEKKIKRQEKKKLRENARKARRK